MKIILPFARGPLVWFLVEWIHILLARKIPDKNDIFKILNIKVFKRLIFFTNYSHTPFSFILKNLRHDFGDG